MSTRRKLDQSEVVKWLRIVEATIIHMRDDVDVLLATWSLSAAILFLVYVGQMNDVVGGTAVMVLMRFDLEVFINAYNQASSANYGDD